MRNKKNKFSWTLKAGPVIGFLALGTYWYLYGAEWLGRLLLGSIIFASVTSTYVLYGFNKIKNKKIK